MARWVLAAVFLTAAAWGEDVSRPNVVLLSVDTLRADHLGCYGHERDTSPAVDAFAATGLLFEDTVCEVPLTSPSFGSMLSSRYPRETGTTRNGLRMPGHVPLVQERFRDAGYETFCAQSNWTLKAKLSGLDRGFERYDDGFHKKRWGFIKAERVAEEVADTALALLESRDPARPFFAWIHFTDPHAPYTFHRKHNPAGKRPFRQPREEKVGIQYDSEVAYCDAHIARVLAALPENTAVVFTADHGESLWEHDYLGHGRRIYQPGLHIPLAIRAPGLAPGRTAAPARGIDIGPTLLGLAGIAPAEGMLGIDLLAAPPAPDRVRVVETYGGAVPNLPGARAMMADAPPMRQGAIADGWKLILDGDDAELFDLATDPGELENRSDFQPDRLEALRAHIAAWDAATARVEPGEEDLSAEDMRALEALGYVE